MIVEDHSVYGSIREQIFDGRLPPNYFINIQLLANLHKVSVVPVREALIRLSAEGLLEYNKSRGFMPPLLSMQALIDNYEILFNLVSISIDRILSTKAPNLLMQKPSKRADITEFTVHSITAPAIDDALEIFASRIMTEQFYSCFIRELRKSRSFRYRVFEFQKNKEEVSRYLTQVSNSIENKDFENYKSINRAFYKLMVKQLTNLHQLYTLK
ncbi:GntR family transcriptional regulator [Agrobacterium rhizogenes]|nr:GntR family transcriptional regulator [Rhizobium rhizogenes]